MNIKEIRDDLLFLENAGKSWEIRERTKIWVDNSPYCDITSQKLADVIVNIANFKLLTHIKGLEADLLTASTRDTAQLELIGKLEAENKRLREASKVCKCKKHIWNPEYPKRIR